MIFERIKSACFILSASLNSKKKNIRNGVSASVFIFFNQQYFSLMKNTTIFSFPVKPQDGYRKYFFNRYAIFLLLLMCSLASPKAAFSQYYNVNTGCSNVPYNDISLTGTALTLNPDNITYDSNLPFDFQFFGQNYVQPNIKVSTHGYIIWNTNTGLLAIDNQSLPITDTDLIPGGGIFPMWDYMGYFIAPGTGVQSKIDGIAPNRTFTVQWTNLSKFLVPFAVSTGTVGFQVVFYESTNVIKYIYNDTYFGATYQEGSEGNNGASATIGLQKGNAPGKYYQTSYNNSTLLENSQCVSYTPSQTTNGCTMACSTSNISIPANCQTTLLAEDFLTSANNCATSYIIQLLATETGPILEQGVDSLIADGIDINNVPYPLVGQTYVIKIIENLISGAPNMCWNYHNFEDYLPPVINCRNADTVICYEPAVLYSLEGISDCSGAITAHVIDSVYTPYTCEDDDFLLGRIIRSYYLEDESGNQSAVCNDTLYLAPPSLDSVVFPLSVLDLSCSVPFAEDADGHPSPSQTGYPVIGDARIPIYVNNLSLVCNITASYHDNVVPAGCNTKYMRTWTVYYWSCDGEQELNYLQTIMVNDLTPPVVTAPADVTIAAGPNCSASYLIPPASIVDDCGHLGTTVVTHPNGVTPQNGGFTINNVPVGIYNIIYSVNDGCGHISRDTMVLTIQDLISPAAICKNAIVSLDNTGNGRMFASSINNGSHDNGCGGVTVKVKRMLPDCNGLPNQSDVFADYIDFYCCDVANNPIMVILEVTDAGGLKSTCMAEVTVQNKNNPIVAATLPNIIVPCGTVYDVNNLYLTFGKYVISQAARDSIIIDGVYKGLDGLITGVCDANIVELTPEVNIGTCGFGTIVRKFSYSGNGNPPIIIFQNITINSAGVELKASDFIAPLDYTSTNDACDPGDIIDLGPLYEPRLKPGVEGCYNLMTNSEDQVFAGQGGACFKIVRTWTILDWCLAEAKGLAYAQEHAIHFVHSIVIMNTTKPTFAPHADQAETTLICDGKEVTVTTSATDDCPSNYLVYNWQIDYNFNNVNATWDASGNGNSFTRFMPIGHHRVHFAVVDGCGNLTDQFFFVNVVNNKQPTPLYKNLVVDLMANLTVAIPARLFNAGSTGACPGSTPLRFSYTSNPADSIKIFDCSFGVDVPFGVNIYVIDNNGLVDFATPSLTLNDNIVQCPDNITLISGRIVTEGAQGIPQVDVNAQASMMKQTDSNGEFRFNNVQSGTTYSIEPSDDKDPLNGVTTGDIIKIQNHILNKKVLDSPYKLIAADVSEDKQLSVSDIVMIRRLILAKIDQFSSGKSWKFIDESYTFPNPANPLNADYPQSIDAATTGIKNDVNFIGIKMGDVNGDFTLSLDGGSLEVREKASLTMEDISMVPGQTYNVAISNDDLNKIAGIQAAFELSAGVRLEGISSNLFTVSNENYSLNGNRLMLSIADIRGNEAGKEVFTFELSVDKPMKLSEAISQNTEATLKSEIYNEVGDGTAFEIKFTGNKSGLIVEQNVPNPFTDHTQISFILDQEDLVTLKVYDINGRILKSSKGNYAKGRNTISIINNELDANGVLFYELTTAQGSVTKKMIKLK